MRVLGVCPARAHDPAAALLVDGKLVAAVEEERFNRIKHSPDTNPVKSVEYCLKTAGLRIEDIDAIALSRSFGAALSGSLKYALRMRRYPVYGLLAVKRTPRYNRCMLKDLEKLTEHFGRKLETFKFVQVEHHMAHLASAYYFSGFKDAALLSMDGRGEFASAVFAEGRGGKITKIKEFHVPDSMGYFYSTITRFLGFRANDGEFKTMGMAPFGDPSKIDLSPLIKFTEREFRVNEDYMWPMESMKRHRSYIKAKDLSSLFGPPREGDGLSEPYIHIAAAAQKVLEDVVLGMIKYYLSDVLKRCGGKICFAGGTALNVSLNRKILELPGVTELFVPPAAHDAGTALGAAGWAAAEMGDKIAPMEHAYLGPEYSNDEIKAALDTFKLPYEKSDNIEETAARLLAEGKIVAWFQGRMEYGPRALGNRSILANPSTKGVADRVNEIIKFRENWRPFCPSMLAERAPELIGTKHSSDYMTLSFLFDREWAKKVPEIVHVDGTARPQTVRKDSNPRFHKLITEFDKLTGLPVLLNTSLNRRNEPMVCSPRDAVAMFYQCGLEYLAIGDYLLKKRP
jgi:carbamoyltransferase